MPSNIESPYPKPRPDEFKALVTARLETDSGFDIFCFGADGGTTHTVFTIANEPGVDYSNPPYYPILHAGKFTHLLCYDGFQVHHSPNSPVDVNEGDLFYILAYYAAGFFRIELVVNYALAGMQILNVMSNTDLYATLVFKPLPTN